MDDVINRWLRFTEGETGLRPVILVILVILLLLIIVVILVILGILVILVTLVIVVSISKRHIICALHSGPTVTLKVKTQWHFSCSVLQNCLFWPSGPSHLCACKPLPPYSLHIIDFVHLNLQWLLQACGERRQVGPPTTQPPTPGSVVQREDRKETVPLDSWQK